MHIFLKWIPTRFTLLRTRVPHDAGNDLAPERLLNMRCPQGCTPEPGSHHEQVLFDLEVRARIRIVRTEVWGDMTKLTDLWADDDLHVTCCMCGHKSGVRDFLQEEESNETPSI